MMIIPSIFFPEDWSFTFYEGLNRHQDSIFKDKTVAELGCGNGWITIAIAAKWLPMKVIFFLPECFIWRVLFFAIPVISGFWNALVDVLASRIPFKYL